VLDAYGLPRNYFVETSHDNCEIAAEAPDVIPSNAVPDTATRTSSVSDVKTPAKEIMPPEPSDDMSKEKLDGKNPAQDKVTIESAVNPSVVDNVPKTPSETTQDNNASSESAATPQEINIPSDTMAEMPSDMKEDKV